MALFSILRVIRISLFVFHRRDNAGFVIVQNRISVFPFTILLICSGALFNTLCLTPRTLVLLQWSSVLWSDLLCPDLEKNTCWFSWWETRAGYSGSRHTDLQVPGIHSRPYPRGLVRSRTYSYVRCPGKALPTPDSSSGRDEHHPVTGCAGLWSSGPSFPSPSNKTKTMKHTSAPKKLSSCIKTQKSQTTLTLI